MNIKLLGVAALLVSPMLVCNTASAEPMGATQELKEECLQRYSGLLSKPVLKTPDACWRSVGYLFDDATVARYAAKGAAEKVAGTNKTEQH